MDKVIMTARVNYCSETVEFQCSQYSYLHEDPPIMYDLLGTPLNPIPALLRQNLQDKATYALSPYPIKVFCGIPSKNHVHRYVEFPYLPSDSFALLIHNALYSPLSDWLYDSNHCGDVEILRHNYNNYAGVPDNYVMAVVGGWDWEILPFELEAISPNLITADTYQKQQRNLR